jgi:elongation factor Ts
MPDFSAKDVQTLRQATGVGMMDAKKALQENGGDFEAAKRWLREHGIIKAEARSGRANEQGAVGVSVDGNVGAIVQLRSETDFVAKSEAFLNLLDELVHLAVAKGESAVDERKDAIDDLRISLKENIEVGRVVRFEAADGNVLDSYLHIQSDRGVNAVLVELANGSRDVAHEVAINIAFHRPPYVSRDDVPAEDVAAERETLETITRAEGKPESAIEKIVEGRLTGWFRERVLLEQPYVRDEKRTVAQLLGDATVVRFAQVVIGS